MDVMLLTCSAVQFMGSLKLWHEMEIELHTKSEVSVDRKCVFALRTVQSGFVPLSKTFRQIKYFPFSSKIME